MSNRDTQFEGFAHLLLMEFVDNHSMALNWDKSFLDLKLLIARRAYDFALHVGDHIDDGNECEHVSEFINDIPDMTEFSKEQES